MRRNTCSTPIKALHSSFSPAFFLALTASYKSVSVFCCESVAMAEELLQKMSEQMAHLREEVEALRAERIHRPLRDDEEEEEGEAGSRLIPLSEATKALLETAFSSNLSNPDRRKRVDRFGVPECNHTRCPKLDAVLKTTLPKDAIKADSYLSRLQQFWLDAVAPLTTVLENAEAGILTTESATAAVQSALVLMGNANQHMAQERRKRVLMNVNPALKTMAEEEKGFQNAAPMLFGEAFAKQATERVEAVKAIKKLSYNKTEREHPQGRFSGYHPRNQQTGRGGGYRGGRGRYTPYQNRQRQGQQQDGSGQGSQSQRN